MAEYVDSIEPFEFLIDPDTATAEEIAELFTELTTLYQMAGGTDLVFTVEGGATDNEP